MIKMVVSSFYNTLINQEEAIPTSTMLEIERIRKKNILFSVCTNRHYKEVLEYNNDFPFIDYIISLNGSYIYDVNKKRCISKKKISNSILKKMDLLFPEYKKIYYTETDIKESWKETDTIPIYKIEIEIPEWEDSIKNKIEKIKLNYSILEKDNKTFLEIISPKSNMFFGVDQISLKNEINLKDIVVIGSNDSDYSLIQNIQNSYITKNSSPRLKKITKRVTSSNNDKGVEKIIRKI